MFPCAILDFPHRRRLASGSHDWEPAAAALRGFAVARRASRHPNLRGLNRSYLIIIALDIQNVTRMGPHAASEVDTTVIIARCIATFVPTLGITLIALSRILILATLH